VIKLLHWYLYGVSSGEKLTVIIALKDVDVDPSAKTVTVYFD
jgi:hypothetical protein